MTRMDTASKAISFLNPQMTQMDADESVAYQRLWLHRKMLIKALFIVCLCLVPPLG